MVAVKERSCGHGFGLAGERVGATVVLGRNMFQPGVRGSQPNGGEEDDYPTRLVREKTAPAARQPGPGLHRAPPFEERNQLPICGTSTARPARYTRSRLDGVRPKPGEKLSRMPRGSCQPSRGAM